MAKVVKNIPFRSGQMYPWDEWLDGQIWELTLGIDFNHKITSFRMCARSAAERRGGMMDTKKLLAELDRSDAICAAATPGPWERRDTLIGIDNYHASTEIVGNVVRVDDEAIASAPACKLAAGFIWFEGDCEFIPHARTELPARNRQLREALSRISELEAVVVPLEKMLSQGGAVLLGQDERGITMYANQWKRFHCRATLAEALAAAVKAMEDAT